jgi:hypothetical protein
MRSYLTLVGLLALGALAIPTLAGVCPTGAETESDGGDFTLETAEADEEEAVKEDKADKEALPKDGEHDNTEAEKEETEEETEETVGPPEGKPDKVSETRTL